LQGYWEDATVLDLFAGTGNLSIEALSRGAKHVDAVELNAKSLQIIVKNIELLKIGPELKTIRKDVFKYVKEYKGEPYDLILIDPPFTESIAHPVMEEVAKSALYKDSTIIVIESSKQERMDLVYGDLKSFDSRHFGDKLATFFRKEIVSP
jgi:16S rRNA (guanine966-N2)-methyltransferase